MAKGWLDNYNDSTTSAPEGIIGDGYSNVGRNSSPAWGGQFQEGGKLYTVNNDPYETKLSDKEIAGYNTWKSKLPKNLQNDYDYDLQ